MLYQPNWESLDSRPCPAWFDEAKFGIFIHWGLYSVPAWGPKGQYAEWYWSSMGDREGDTWRFHARAYGERFRYQDFASYFKAELFEPDRWADLFVRSGARYVALTSKHHDGFCLWPSRQSWNWNSLDAGPHRDLAGDLAEAVRKRGLKMGFYYSLYEWYRPLYLEDPKRYAVEHMIPQLEDLITRYEPSILYTDGEWDHPSDVWQSARFLAWLFNESPCREEIVINDRWGKETRSLHGGYYTTEYGEVGWGKPLQEGRKWEECRGIGSSFGYNRNEDAEDYMTARGLVHLLADTVGKGGNLFLNVGPTADGRIPAIMQDRLLAIGRWLEVNGEAIYGTRPWKGDPGEPPVRFISKGNTLYAICLTWPGSNMSLPVSRPAAVSMLGLATPLQWHYADDRLLVELPFLSPEAMPCDHAYVLKVELTEPA